MKLHANSAKLCVRLIAFALTARMNQHGPRRLNPATPTNNAIRAKEKDNAKAPRRPRTAKTPCLCSHCPTLPVTVSHPNRQYGVHLASWRSFFASSRLGVAALVIHPIALAATGSADDIRALLRETPRELSETPRPLDDCFIRRTETASRTLGRHATGRCKSGAIVVGHPHGTPYHASAMSRRGPTDKAI